MSPRLGVDANSVRSIDTATVPLAPTGTENATPDVIAGADALKNPTPGAMSALPSMPENPAATYAYRGFATESPTSSVRTGRRSVLLSVGATANRAATIVGTIVVKSMTKLPYRPSKRPVRIAPRSKPTTAKSGTPSPFVSRRMSNSLSEGELHRFHVFTAKMRRLRVLESGTAWTPTARRSFEVVRRCGLERPQA